MTMLTILCYPDKRLRRIAKPVTQFSPKLLRLANDMLYTMYNSRGIGLAATQVNVTKRLIVLDTSGGHEQPLVLVNPQIIKKSGSIAFEEGCLSVPGFCASVQRAAQITVKAQDTNGEPVLFTTDDLQAVCIQHEIDHLNGKLFVDHLTDEQRLAFEAALAAQNMPSQTITPDCPRE